MVAYKRLPESELDIMLAVWKGPSPITAPQIMDALERPLTASALHSYLSRLEEKGFLDCRKEGRNNFYTPLITRKEYQGREGRTVLDKLYGSSLKRFAAALYDGGEVSRAELAELHAYLDELDKEGH